MNAEVQGPVVTAATLVGAAAVVDAKTRAATTVAQTA